MPEAEASALDPSEQLVFGFFVFWFFWFFGFWFFGFLGFWGLEFRV